MVAVTGGVAEGKSTVLRHLEGLGRRVVSADEIVRRTWGEIPDELLRVVGESRREDVRARVLRDPAARRRLNARLHGPVMAEILGSGAEFAEVPLLIEACHQEAFTEIWVVTCGPEEQRRRLIERLGDPEAADSMLRTQLPTRAKAAFADWIVRTDRPRETVLAEVSERSLRVGKHRAILPSPRP